MNFIKKNGAGLLLCLAIAVPSWFLGKLFSIIVCTIATSLVIAFVLHKVMKIPSKISTLVGVGSSICGGSAIAATAPVINADDEEVAQAISVIFFFNVLAAILFPTIGSLIGFSNTSGEAFGIFAGTAVNDTSSVTAAASIITTVASNVGVPASIFAPVKELSKFFIVSAMAAIGLNSNIVKLIKTGGKPILMGACCWVGIAVVSLVLQHVLGIW